MAIMVLPACCSSGKPFDKTLHETKELDQQPIHLTVILGNIPYTVIRVLNAFFGFR
jgi:hypothetical protein